MANLLKDDNSFPIPQYLSEDGTHFEQVKGKNGAMYTQIIAGTSLIGKVDIQGATISATYADQQSKTTPVILQDAASAIGNGTPFTVGAYRTLNIKIAGSSVSRTVVFEAAGFDGVYEPIMGIKPQDFSTTTQTIGNNESWSFDVTGFELFRARIAAIMGTQEVASLAISAAPTAVGNVTVNLNGVATNIAATSGVAEVASLQITNATGATANGNVTINLNGVAATVALATTDNTPALVATKIRGTAFAGWTTGGATDTVTFTATAVGIKADATYDAGTTGATGTMTTTTQGVDADTATAVATKIRGTAFAGWTTGGTGTTVTFTSTTDGNKVDATYSAGTSGATAIMTTTTQGTLASLSVKGKAVA